MTLIAGITRKVLHGCMCFYNTSVETIFLVIVIILRVCILIMRVWCGYGAGTGRIMRVWGGCGHNLAGAGRVQVGLS